MYTSIVCLVFPILLYQTDHLTRTLHVMAALCHVDGKYIWRMAEGCFCHYDLTSNGRGDFSHTEPKLFRNRAFHFIVHELQEKLTCFWALTRGIPSACHVWNLVSVKWLHSVKQITGGLAHSCRCKSVITFSKHLMRGMRVFSFLWKTDKGLQLTFISVMVKKLWKNKHSLKGSKEGFVK